MRKISLRDWCVPVIVWSIWLVFVTGGHRWHLFIDNWFMSVTMAVGSFIAGSTSEGGGAVAFPVMTLLFDIPPAVARDFSLMIQSVGMSAAAIAILWRGILFEPKALVFSSLGGVCGVGIGIEVFSPHLPPVATKLFFVTLWLSFGVALLWMNRDRQRIFNRQIEHFQPVDAVLFAVVGLIGGIVSGLTGSGLDIVTFSLLVLAFRVNETIATPTSVILMAGNAIVGFAWRLGFGTSPIAPETWHYWWVSIPVVVIGAPLGARFIATRSQQFVVRLLLSSIVTQFALALLILPVTPLLGLFSVAVFAIGILLFSAMSHIGSMRLQKQHNLNPCLASKLSD